MSNTITITGSLGRDAELRITPSGTAILNGSVADTPRKFDRDTNAWVDAGDTLWLNFSVFGDDAEALADGLVKGAKVTIVGKLKSRSWEKDGQTRTANEITADSVAVHAKKGAGQQQARPQGQAQNKDPWS